MLFTDSTGLATTDDWARSPGSLVFAAGDREDRETGELNDS
jgi:hypothetical protein